MKKSTIIGIVTIVIVVVVIWLVVASSKAPVPQMPPMTSTDSTQQSAPMVASKSVAVTISDFAFSPTTLQVAKGTTVTWTNHDSMAHTVTSVPGGPSSGNIAQGESYSFTFNTSGTFNYHCAIHPGMVGTVIVQ